jgi:predicted MFS family arabinose efflux permease
MRAPRRNLVHALVVDVTEEEHRGKITALYNAAFNLGVTATALAPGPIGEAWGYRFIFVAGAAALALGLGLFVARAPREAR